MNWRRFGVTCTMVLAIADATIPVHGGTAGPSRAVAYDTHLAMERRSPFGKLAWTFLGPTNVSGRANAIAVADRGGRRRVYVGYSGGGVWKTDDAGLTMQPVFERAASTAINAIAVAPSNPDIVWIVTGTHRSHIPLASAGVYRSTNGGVSWQHMGLDTMGEGGFNRIAIHRTNPDIVYVAASGGPDRLRNQRGVFRTTDGGRAWKAVLTVDPDAGAGDLVMDPSDSRTLYAAVRLRVRGIEPAFQAALKVRPTLFRTTDGGETWSEIASGLPDPAVRAAIAVDVARSSPNVVYALVNNLAPMGQTRAGMINVFGQPVAARQRGSEVYRSDDRGKTWRQVSRNDDNALHPPRPESDAWNSRIRVDPKDPDSVFVLGQDLTVSHDGGRSFRSVGGIHSDNNDVWIDAHSPDAFVANDFGVYRLGPAQVLTAVIMAPVSQVYNVELDVATPARVYGSFQDQGSYRGEVRLGPGRSLLAPVVFELAPGAEVANHVVDPTELNTVYTTNGLNGNSVNRFDLTPGIARGRQNVTIQPGGARGRGRGEATPTTEPDLRGAWLFPLLLSPHDARTIYAGYQFLYRSKNRGDSWERISADLSGVASLELRRPDFVGLAISSIAESPMRKGLLYAGTDNGRLHVTMDDGQSWNDVTANLPHSTFVSRVVASASVEGTVYVMLRGRDADDFAPYLYRSADYGKTFSNLVGNIPAGPVNVLREDPGRPTRLYVGTDFGVYVSDNGGASWDVLGRNLQSVPVTDLRIHPRDHTVVISTFGRGFWAMDAQRIGGGRP